MFKTLFSRAAVLAAALLMFSSAAMAQAVLVVDQAKVLRDSRAGQSLTSQLKSIDTQIKNELTALETPIKSEQSTIEALTRGKTQAQVAADPSLKARVEKFGVSMQKYEIERRYKSQELVVTAKKAEAQIGDQFAQIVKAILAERGASVIVDRSSVIHVAPSADVTQDVINRLNSQLSSVSVVRERLPRQ